MGYVLAYVRSESEIQSLENRRCTDEQIFLLGSKWLVLSKLDGGTWVGKKADPFLVFSRAGCEEPIRPTANYPGT